MNQAPPRSECRSQWLLVLVGTLTLTVSLIDRQTLGVLAPSVTKALGISEAQYGWLVAAFSMAYVVGTPVGGILIERVGARRGLVGAVMLWSVVAAAHAFAPSFAVLFALRLALGLAEGPSFPGASQTVHRALAARDRPRGYGMLFTGSAIGTLLAPIVATYCAASWGWRSGFIATASAGLVWLALWFAIAFRPKARARLDDRFEDVVAQREKAWSLRTLVGHPAVIRLFVLILSAAPALLFVTAWSAKVLVRRFGLSQVSLGHYLWLPALCFDLGSLAFGDLASRRPRGGWRWLVLTAGFLVLALVAMPSARGPAEAVAAAGLSAAGAGGIYAVGTADLLARVPRGSVSRASSFVTLAQSIAIVVAAPLIGRSADAFDGFAFAMVGCGLWVVPGVVVWLVWEPDSRANAEPHETGSLSNHDQPVQVHFNVAAAQPRIESIRDHV